MVDLEAVKHNLAGLSEDEVPNLKESLARGMKLFIPVGVLLFMMLGMKTTPMKAAILPLLRFWLREFWIPKIG